MDLNSALNKLILNVVLMILTLLLVWVDLGSWKKFFSCLLAITFIGLNYYYDNSSDQLTSKNQKASKYREDSLTHMNDSLTHVIINKTDSIKDIQLATKDTIKAAIDSSYQHSITASNKALAGFSLSLQDSLRTLKINSNQGELSIAPVTEHESIFIKQEGETRVLAVQFISGLGTAYNIDLKYYIFLNALSGFKLGTKIGLSYNNLIDSGYVIGPQTILSQVVSTFEMTLATDTYKQANAFIVIVGTFSKDDTKSKQKEFIEAFTFDFQKNSVIGNVRMLRSHFPYGPKL